MSNGKLIFIVSVLSLVWSGWGAPLNCDSHLRIVLPELFTHCTSCQYSDWSEWEFVKDSTVDVPTSQCDSGQSYKESRSRSVTGDGCDSDIETRVICLPDQVDLLIDSLGLGSSVDADTTGTPGTPGTIPTTETPVTPSQGPPGPRSVDVAALFFLLGKRSLSEENRPFIRTGTRKREEPAPLPEAPIPYNRKEHGKRFRRAPRACQPNGEQNVLFVLDTSTSITEDIFEEMTKAVSKLTAFFCSPPKIAALTYSTDFNLEFCFDCFTTDFNGRLQASAAIRNIPYRGGITNTGGAARCICDKLLSPACGLHPFATCTDVVFITDGRSNDGNLKVCEEVKCLHNHLNGINTYAIGIDNYDEDEIKCISSSSNLQSVFQFEDFDDFEAAIEEIQKRLLYLHEYYTCVHTDEQLGN